MMGGRCRQKKREREREGTGGRVIAEETQDDYLLISALCV